MASEAMSRQRDRGNYVRACRASLFIGRRGPRRRVRRGRPIPPRTREDTLRPWFRKPWPWLRKSVHASRNPNIVAARDQRNGFSGGRRFIRSVDGKKIARNCVSVVFATADRWKHHSDNSNWSAPIERRQSYCRPLARHRSKPREATILGTMSPDASTPGHLTKGTLRVLARPPVITRR